MPAIDISISKPDLCRRVLSANVNIRTKWVMNHDACRRELSPAGMKIDQSSCPRPRQKFQQRDPYNCRQKLQAQILCSFTPDKLQDKQSKHIARFGKKTFIRCWNNTIKYVITPLAHFEFIAHNHLGTGRCITWNASASKALADYSVCLFVCSLINDAFSVSQTI
jgi:hypothetical protein